MNVTATKKMKQVAENMNVTVEQVAQDAFGDDQFKKVHCFKFSQRQWFKTGQPSTWKTQFWFRCWEPGAAREEWTCRTVSVARA